MQLASHKCEVSAVLYNRCTVHAATDPAAVTPSLTGLNVYGQQLKRVQPTTASKYLGLYVSLTLDWGNHTQAALNKFKNKADAIYRSKLSGGQRILMEAACLFRSRRHTFCVAPYSQSMLQQLDAVQARLHKFAIGLPSSAAHAAIFAPTTSLGMGTDSLLLEYSQVCAETQISALNNAGRLSTLSRAMFHWLRTMAKPRML